MSPKIKTMRQNQEENIHKGILTAQKDILTAAKGILTAAKGMLTAAKGILTAAKGILTAAKGILTAAKGILTTAKGILTTAKGIVKQEPFPFQGDADTAGSCKIAFISWFIRLDKSCALTEVMA
jgi:hypothetical protein